MKRPGCAVVHGPISEGAFGKTGSTILRKALETGELIQFMWTEASPHEEHLPLLRVPRI